MVPLVSKSWCTRWYLSKSRCTRWYLSMYSMVPLDVIDGTSQCTWWYLCTRWYLLMHSMVPLDVLGGTSWYIRWYPSMHSTVPLDPYIQHFFIAYGTTTCTRGSGWFICQISVRWGTGFRPHPWCVTWKAGIGPLGEGSRRRDWSHQSGCWMTPCLSLSSLKRRKKIKWWCWLANS